MLNTFTRFNPLSPVKVGDHIAIRNEEDYTGPYSLDSYWRNILDKSGKLHWYGRMPYSFNCLPIHLPIKVTGTRSGAVDFKFNIVYNNWSTSALKFSTTEHWLYRNMVQKIEYDEPPVCPVELFHLKRGITKMEMPEPEVVGTDNEVFYGGGISSGLTPVAQSEAIMLQARAHQLRAQEEQVRMRTQAQEIRALRDALDTNDF
jgi:hypothetical protein